MSANEFSLAIGEIDNKYIMEALSYSATQSVVRIDKRNNRKLMIVAALVAALLLVGFTFAPMIIEMISGRTVEWDENHLFASGTADSIVEVQDGHVYFTLDNSDITEYCSETTYFRYDYTDEQGISHVFLIGGELDTIGWTEILFLENGKRLSHSNYMTENDNPPVWYVKGNAEVNDDYGYILPNSKTTHSYEIEIEPEVVKD